MKATKIMNSIRDNHPEWLEEFNNILLRNLYDGELLNDAVLHAARFVSYFYGQRGDKFIDPLLIKRTIRLNKYYPTIRIDNCENLRRRRRRFNLDEDPVLAWHVFVRSNECDSYYQEIFYASMREAIRAFQSQFFNDDGKILKDKNGNMYITVRNGDSWWEYTLEQA